MADEVQPEVQPDAPAPEAPKPEKRIPKEPAWFVNQLTKLITETRGIRRNGTTTAFEVHLASALAIAEAAFLKGLLAKAAKENGVSVEANSPDQPTT